jgi:hypothetical protein
MSSEIEVGTILLEDRPAITQALELQGESFSRGWSTLNTIGGSALESKVGAAGWRCFFLAGEVKATVFGRPTAQNSQRAVRRILAKVRDSNFNCFEVTRIAAGAFLGIPYATVGGHSRHIQQEWLLQGEKERQHVQTDADWARG